MTEILLNELLFSVFSDDTLYGYSDIDDKLKAKTGCKCALVTCMNYPDLEKRYRPDEFFLMNNELATIHAQKLQEIKYMLIGLTQQANSDLLNSYSAVGGVEGVGPYRGVVNCPANRNLPKLLKVDKPIRKLLKLVTMSSIWVIVISLQRNHRAA